MERNIYLLKEAKTTLTGEAFQTRPIKKTFQLIGKTSSGVGAASVDVEFSNDPTKNNWVLAGTITLTLGTSETSDGFYSNTSWTYARGKINSISGTDAELTLIMGL